VDLSLLLFLLCFGILGGFLSGLVGVGGGIIFVPVFDYIFRNHGIEGEELVRYILANSFLAILFAGIFSSIQQYKKGNFHRDIIGYIVLPAMLAGGITSKLIAAYNWYGNAEFKLFFVMLLAFTLWRSLKRKRARSESTGTEIPRSKYYLIGGITGIVSALSGLGGGVAMIPLLRLIAHKDMRTSSSISIGVIPIMVIPFSVAYGWASPLSQVGSMQLGYLQLAFIVPLVGGILFGAPFGVRIAHKIENHQLQFIFALLLIILIIKYLIEVIS